MLLTEHAPRKEDMSDLPSPVAVVTGAARGIGFATATGLARKGFRVALADSDEAALKLAGQRIAEPVNYGDY